MQEVFYTSNSEKILDTNGEFFTVPMLNSLLAQDVSTDGYPFVGIPLATHVHTLLADSVITPPLVVDAVEFAQIHNISPEGITTSPVVDKLNLFQTHDFIAKSVGIGVYVDFLTSDGSAFLASDAAFSVKMDYPSVASPSLVQAHAFSTSDIELHPVVVDGFKIGQRHGLATGDITTHPAVVADLKLIQVHGLATQDMSIGNPLIGSPFATHVHVVQPKSIYTLSAYVNNTLIGQRHVVNPPSVYTGKPEARIARIYQTHRFAAEGVLAGSEEGLFTSDGSVFLDSLGNVVIVQRTHPVVGVSRLNQICSLTPRSVIHPYSYRSSIPVFNQICNLQLSTLQMSSLIDSPLLAGIHKLNSDSVFSGLPFAGPPVATIVVLLGSTSILTGLPILGTPGIYYAVTLDVPAHRIVKILWESRMTYIPQESRSISITS